jgi:molecular chaperone GrpE
VSQNPFAALISGQLTLDEQTIETIREMEARLETILAAVDGLQPDAELAEQLRKLAKTQFKANTLQEEQLARQQETLEALQNAVDRQTKQRQEAVEAAQLELLKTLLPVMDGLDAAFESGRRQLLRYPLPVEPRRAIIAWLDGVRLARLRLLDVLAEHNVKPIPTVDEPFDPHYHVVSATDESGQAPDGIIVGEDRPGYATPDKVLRFAEVVVSRSP